MPPAVVVGLIAPLTGRSFQEDIAMTARQLQPWGRDILGGAPHPTGGIQEAHTPPLASHTPPRPPTVQWGGSALGPCALSHSAQPRGLCPLSSWGRWPLPRDGVVTRRRPAGSACP